MNGGGAGPPGPSRPRPRREREREAARATILAAALDLARSEGWDAVTMRRLAERIEYSANFAYRYFGGRDDILLALVRDGFARLRERMAAAAAPDGRGADAPADAVRRAGHAYLDFALAEPDLYRVMYGLGGVHVSTADTVVEGEAVGDLLTALLTDAGDPAAGRHVVRLWATAQGLVALLGDGRLEPVAGRLHALLDDALDDVLRGLSAPGSDLP